MNDIPTSVTGFLRGIDDTLTVHDEGEWSGTKSAYSAFNDAGVECEVGEFLYAFVRMLKPTRVLETGTHHGIGASYMGVALLHGAIIEQDRGIQKTWPILDTLEFLPEIRAVALERLKKMGLLGNSIFQQVVHSHLADAATFVPAAPYQFMLLDTEPQTRFVELVRFYEYLTPGGYVFIHDLHQHMHQVESPGHEFGWPYGKLPETIKGWVNADMLRPFHVETPRGLTGFYKPHPNDYKWR